MDVIVPFSTDRPKSRLSDVLSANERAAFSGRMLSDVLAAVVDAGGDPRILATGEVDVHVPGEVDVDVPVDVDERSLSTAVNDALDEALEGDDDVKGGVAIVMADLALATPAALRLLFDDDGDVVIAPGRGGGTNALVVRHGEFRVDYHGASYLDHRRIADEIGACVREVDSHRLATDIDETADLAEVLIHGDGAAERWLREAGFAIDASDGRVGVVRE